MEGESTLISWVVPIHAGEQLLGTGIVVAERTIVTCSHVLGATASEDVIVGKAGACTGRIVRREQARDTDLAVLETDATWPEVATLLLDPTVSGALAPDAEVIALGYGRDFAGRKLARVRCRGQDFSRSEQRLEAYASGNVTLFRAEVLLEEGFSGGPLVVANGKRHTVLGINALGGQYAPMAGFIPGSVVARLLYKEGITPRCVLPKAGVVSVQTQTERWRQMLDLPGTSVLLNFQAASSTLAERFHLLPPDDEAPEPLLVQESVISEVMTNRSGQPEGAAHGFSLGEAQAFIDELTARTRVPLRLLRSHEWLNAVTAGSSETLPLCRARQPAPSRFISRLTPKNRAGFRPPPLGLHEITLATHANSGSASEMVRACSAEATRDGAPVSVHLDRNDYAPSATFRLAIPAFASLQALAPQWSGRPV